MPVPAAGAAPGRLRRLALAGVIAALAACGGGSDPAPPVVSGTDPSGAPTIGSGGNAPSGSGSGGGPPYRIEGKLTVTEAQVVDSDTNDPNQVGRRGNDSFDTVQSLPNPVHLTGYVTVAGGGPDGPSKAAGDPIDGYAIQLKAGQVIELDFNADPRTIDIDLFLYDRSRRVVGRSTGTNSYECIRVATDGDYVIGVETYLAGSTTGSIYQLRIGAPGAAGSCANGQIASDVLLPNRIVATPTDARRAQLADPAVRSKALGGFDLLVGDAGAGGPLLLGLPAAAGARLAAVDASLGTFATPGAAATTKAAAAPGGAQHAWRAALPDEARAIRETIDAAKLLASSGAFVSAQPDFALRAYATDRLAAFPPDDREYFRQRWHYEAIGLPDAMRQLATFTPPNPRNPIVAVLDSGIVADHPDLRGQLVAGYDLVSNAENANDGGGIDENPDDASTQPGAVFHGSHVAGTIAAETYNQTGVAGVAPIARVMPVRILGSNGRGSYFDIEQGIRFAAGLPNAAGRTPARRADVINLSLGADGISCEPSSQQLFNEVRAAGVVVVAASGNESTQTRLAPVGFPANCETVFAIAATNAQNERARYSNVGGKNLIAAPGGDTSQSTTGSGAPDGIYSTVATLSATGVRQPSYGYLSGTSMATPHAAGVFALMRWVNPALTVPAIEQLILSGEIVDDLGPAGRDPEFGFGLINARKAVAAALASLNAPGPVTPAGRIEAQPSTISLGSNRASAEFSLRLVGASAERIVSVTTDSTVISVAPKPGAVDPATGLGDYVVTADRSTMAVGSSLFPNVRVQLSPTRTIALPVAIERRAPGAGQGDLGPMYVLVVDADDPSGAIVAQATVRSPANGVYTYAAQVPGTRRITVFAGSDINNDGVVCSRGEACGAYPLLSTSPQVLQPQGNLGGIDFAVAPFGGVNPASALTGRRID